MPNFPTDGPPLVTAERLPVLPLRDVVVFPYVVMPLLVGRTASLAAIEAANEEDRLVLLVAQRDAETQEPAAADLYRVGVVARVRQLSRLGQGTVRVLVEGVVRARVTRYVPGTDCLRAIVEPMPAPVLGNDDEVLLRRTLSRWAHEDGHGTGSMGGSPNWRNTPVSANHVGSTRVAAPSRRRTLVKYTGRPSASSVAAERSS